MKNRVLSCLLTMVSVVAAANDTPRLPDALTGGEFTYTVQKDDSLDKIGSCFGVDAGVLARLNALEYNARLQPGQELRVENRHIVPERLGTGILINLPQRMLFFFKEEALFAAYPVGVGRPTGLRQRANSQCLPWRKTLPGMYRSPSRRKCARKGRRC